MNSSRRYVKRLLFCLICIVMLSKDSFAQYSQYNLNSNNGLPSNNVYRTLVDSKGYLWIATDKGLVKYNGYTTKIFDATSGLRSDDSAIFSHYSLVSVDANRSYGLYIVW